MTQLQPVLNHTGRAIACKSRPYKRCAAVATLYEGLGGTRQRDTRLHAYRRNPVDLRATARVEALELPHRRRIRQAAERTIQRRGSTIRRTMAGRMFEALRPAPACQELSSFIAPALDKTEPPKESRGRFGGAGGRGSGVAVVGHRDFLARRRFDGQTADSLDRPRLSAAYPPRKGEADAENLSQCRGRARRAAARRHDHRRRRVRAVRHSRAADRRDRRQRGQGPDHRVEQCRDRQ